MTKAIGFACLAALVLTGLPTTAANAGDAGVATRKVSYRDLDLTRPEDMKRLRKRVNSAAFGVCVSDAQGRFVGPSAHFRLLCHAEVMRRAEPQLASIEARARQAKAGGAPMIAAASTITIAP